MGSKNQDEQYSEKEAKERFDAALRGALRAPHKPLKEKPKLKKKKAKKMFAERQRI
jgi:hypothetical protein